MTVRSAKELVAEMHSGRISAEDAIREAFYAAAFFVDNYPVVRYEGLPISTVVERLQELGRLTSVPQPEAE